MFYWLYRQRSEPKMKRQYSKQIESNRILDDVHKEVQKNSRCSSYEAKHFIYLTEDDVHEAFNCSSINSSRHSMVIAHPNCTTTVTIQVSSTALPIARKVIKKEPG